MHPQYPAVDIKHLIDRLHTKGALRFLDLEITGPLRGKMERHSEVAGAVYWNFGTLSPCGVIREAIRQRGDVAAFFPDGVIDLGFGGQFGEMSANSCFAVLLDNLTSPVPTSGQASQLSMQPPEKAKVVAERSQASSLLTLRAAA
jgi:hypothetical protein